MYIPIWQVRICYAGLFGGGGGGGAAPAPTPAPVIVQPVAPGTLTQTVISGNGAAVVPQVNETDEQRRKRLAQQTILGDSLGVGGDSGGNSGDGGASAGDGGGGAAAP